MTGERATERQERRNFVNVFEGADECDGSFDEWPVLPAGVDPMPYLTRYRVAQPFFLAADNDHVVIIMAGSGKIAFGGDDPWRMPFDVGDFLYIPAGTAARLIPDGEVVHVRYKAEPAGFEAARWYCRACDAELFSWEFEATAPLPEYLAACEAFNGDEANRTCSRCGTVAPPADLTDITWPSAAVDDRRRSPETAGS